MKGSSIWSMRRIPCTIADLRMMGPHGKESRWPLRIESSHSWQLARKWGPQSCNHKELNSANCENEPWNKFCSTETLDKNPWLKLLPKQRTQPDHVGLLIYRNGEIMSVALNHSGSANLLLCNRKQLYICLSFCFCVTYFHSLSLMHIK